MTVYTGTSPHGQGHETGFAQIVADRLGIDPIQVEVIHGDTGAGPVGIGTYGSRTLAVGGEAIARAADKVADKAQADRAHMLEAAPEDIELRRRQVPGPRLARQGHDARRHLRRRVHPREHPGGHGARAGGDLLLRPGELRVALRRARGVVDVDAETGKVKVVRYVAVDDCGRAINPMLIDGQVHGGIMHAIGQALYEQVGLRRGRASS